MPKNGHITEGMVQKELFDRYVQRGHILITPNAFISSWNWEVDLVTVTGSMYIVDNEIKAPGARSDFLADFRKRKHEDLRACRGPNYFRYVLPTGMCREGELPSYAGLIEYELRDTLFDGMLCLSLCEIKKCPLLHKEPINQSMILSLSKKLMWRCWTGKGVPVSAEARLHPERFSLTFRPSFKLG